MAATSSSPARTARSASSSCACGIAEIDEHPVAHVLGYEAAEALHGLSDAPLIGRNDLTQIFRVHARGQRGRADEVGEHHSDLAALGAVFGGGVGLLDVLAASTDGALPLASLRRAAMASRSFEPVTDVH